MYESHESSTKNQGKTGKTSGITSQGSGYIWRGLVIRRSDESFKGVDAHIFLVLDV